MRSIVNRNVLVRNVTAVNGVKTGHTSRAGYVLVGSASRNGVTVISAVLGDPSEAARDSDSLDLLRYGLGRYRRVDRGARGRALRAARRCASATSGSASSPRARCGARRAATSA